MSFVSVIMCTNIWWQLLENMESKMKGTCVDGTIPKLFEGRMLVSCCADLIENLLYVFNVLLFCCCN